MPESSPVEKVPLDAERRAKRDRPERNAPIKMPNPPDETQEEIPKVGCRDAPGG